MDEISNKAITIGVAVFVTIIIASGIFYVINQIKVIYEQVYETDISIQSSFTEFEAFDNSQKSGIEVLNAVKKYIDNPKVKVIINGSVVNKGSVFYTNYISMKGNDGYTSYLSKLGEDKYISSVSLNESTGITSITFTKM